MSLWKALEVCCPPALQPSIIWFLTRALRPRKWSKRVPTGCPLGVHSSHTVPLWLWPLCVSTSNARPAHSLRHVLSEGKSIAQHCKGLQTRMFLSNVSPPCGSVGLIDVKSASPPDFFYLRLWCNITTQVFFIFLPTLETQHWSSSMWADMKGHL